LNDGGHVEEPLILLAMKKILHRKGVNALSYLAEDGEDLSIREGVKSGSKGPWSEFVFAHMLFMVASELNGRPITEHTLFAHLKGTEFQYYTLLAESLILEVDGWHQGLEKIDNRVIYLGLNHLLRWDLFGWLTLIDGAPGHHQPYCLWTGAAKLNFDLSVKKFCDNIFSSIPHNGFMNAAEQILDKTKRVELISKLKSCGSLFLCISFLFGGFPRKVKPTCYWSTGACNFLLIDSTNLGIQSLPQRLLDMFVAFSKDQQIYEENRVTKKRKISQQEPWQLLIDFHKKEKAFFEKHKEVINKLNKKEKISKEEYNLFASRTTVTELNEFIFLYTLIVPKKQKKILLINLLQSLCVANST